mgnify:CR=1 FL=1
MVEIAQRLPGGGAHVLGYISGTPPVRAKMYTSYAQQQLVLVLENPTQREQTYRLKLTLPGELTWSAEPPPPTVTVASGETREVRVALAGMRSLESLVWIRGTVTPSRGEAVPVFASAQTPLYDTGFENCVSQDGKFGHSLFWHQSYPESMPADIPLSYCGVYADSARTHSGKQSLRFDAKRDSPKAGVASLLGRAEVGHRYKLSAWFYRDHAEDSLLVQIASPGVGGSVGLSPKPTDPVGEWFKLEAVTPVVTQENPLLSLPFARFHT